MLITLSLNIPSRQGGKTDIAAAITKAGSKQTYYTIRLLADRDRRQNAFRAYAYFRWLDDQLDASSGTQQEKKAFVDRQCALLETCYRRELAVTVGLEEQMLVEMVANDVEKDSGLQTYLRSMMGVMAFDVERRGSRISTVELSQYSHMLAKAVTEYMFYFIGHKNPPPCSATRYQAVCGAHVVHMLRDMVGDIAIGYINIPSEIIAEEHITLDDLRSPAFRRWVESRVRLAQRYFEAGWKYVARVKNLRCRLAGFAYLSRFEWMLNTIERDGYNLRPAYPERKSLKIGLWMTWRVLSSLFSIVRVSNKPGDQVTLADQIEEE